MHALSLRIDNRTQLSVRRVYLVAHCFCGFCVCSVSSLLPLLRATSDSFTPNKLFCFIYFLCCWARATAAACHDHTNDTAFGECQDVSSVRCVVKPVGSRLVADARCGCPWRKLNTARCLKFALSREWLLVRVKRPLLC